MNLYRSNGIIALSWIIPYIVSINWLLFGKRYLVEWQVFWKASCILIPVLLIISGLIAVFANRLYKKSSRANNAIKRRMIWVLASFILSISLVNFIFFFLHSIHVLDYQFQFVKFCLALGVTLLATLTTAGLYEAGYVLSQRVATFIETEQKDTKHFHGKSNRSKEQVDPHFFFNCLNCLSSLISEDQHKAVEFLDEMSRVYRHLLNNNQDSLSTLLDELKFLHSYYHLVKTRFGQGIQLQVDVADTSLGTMIPSHTLQLMLENAIKYNVVLKDKPLLVRIQTMGNDQIIIINNLQPRLSIAPFHNIRLENVAKKYPFLNRPGIEMKITKNRFFVTIPLINKRS